MPGQAGEIPKKAPDGRWRWADGTEPTVQEWTAMYAQAAGGPDADLGFLGGSQGAVDIGDLASGQLGANGENAEFYGVLTGTGKTGKDPYGTGVLDAALPKLVGSETPGAELDTAQSDEERRRLAELLGSLQQQATTGGGAWEESLKNATQTASASAMALGQAQQNQTGGNYAASLRNIGNAQAGVQQRAAGQENVLREKSKIAAQDEITGLTSAMGGNAAQQAAAQAAARRGVRATNQSLIDQAEEREMGRADAIGGAFSSMSDGGEVPGEPVVFGDDSRNDVVPAKLSPGEIVLPISVAQSPNAPEAAAAFVRALQQQEAGVAGYAEGGPVDSDTGLHQTTVDEDYGAGNAALSFVLPHIGRMAGFGEVRKKYLGPRAPSVETGGMLDPKQYDESRAAQLQNATLLEQRAAGQGPSVVPQMMQNTSDANIEAALQAQAAGKGGADLVARSAQAQSAAAGQAAGLAMEEQQAGQQGAAKALIDQQARDQAFAMAQQQAAWQNTMLNVGLGLQQQALIDNIVSGAGQGLAALSEVEFGGEKGKDAEGFDLETGKNEYGQSAEDYESNSMEDEYAHGGRVEEDERAEEFVRALSRGGYC